MSNKPKKRKGRHKQGKRVDQHAMPAVESVSIEPSSSPIVARRSQASAVRIALRDYLHGASMALDLGGEEWSRLARVEAPRRAKVVALKRAWVRIGSSLNKVTSEAIRTHGIVGKGVIANRISKVNSKSGKYLVIRNSHNGTLVVQDVEPSRAGSRPGISYLVDA